MQGNNESSDAELIARTIEARRESVKFFESSNRSEREVWVAREFLINLGEGFDESELRSVADDPPDVLFRDARFEIKEIVDAGRRRHSETKLELLRAQNAKSADELFDLVAPKDITYADAIARVRARVDDLKGKYAPASRGQFDLLFYVNLQDIYGYAPSPLPANESWLSYGFRSVSFLMGRLSCVLSATSAAPVFLLKGGTRIVAAPRPGEGDI